MNHLQEATDVLAKTSPKYTEEHVIAHALIAIAEQLEKIGDKVIIQTDGYSMDNIVKIIDAYTENK